LGQSVTTRPGIVPLPLPYLFLYGRRDQTISIMGANIYPADVERALYSQTPLVGGLASFVLIVAENGQGIHPKLCVEWSNADVPELPLERLAEEIEESLTNINSDFRNARNESAENMKIELEIYACGTGPFAGKERRIKNRYFARTI